MEPSYREVFLAIGQLGGSVSEQLVNWSCAEFSCYSQNWLTAFEETRFGSMIDYGANYDLTLDLGAREFLSSKFSVLSNPEKQRISSAVARIKKKHTQAISAEEGKITDRVLIAFRTTAAKAAKLAGQRRDVEEAIRWYDEAVIVDSGNAALFDRFAWYLMVNNQLDRAILISKKACELGPNDADSHFTYGMISARKADVSSADIYLDRSQHLGKQPHLVILQKARARIEKAATLEHSDLENRKKLILSAIDLLEQSTPSGGRKNLKHEIEKEKLMARCHGIIKNQSKQN